MWKEVRLGCLLNMPIWNVAQKWDWLLPVLFALGQQIRHVFFLCIMFCTALLINILTLPDRRGGGGEVEPTPKGFSSITFDGDKILKRNFF